MRYAGVGSKTGRSQGTTNGFREDGGPADIKKTFLYNQKMTTMAFQILEDHPDKVSE